MILAPPARALGDDVQAFPSDQRRWRSSQYRIEPSFTGGAEGHPKYVSRPTPSKPRAQNTSGLDLAAKLARSPGASGTRGGRRLEGRCESSARRSGTGFLARSSSQAAYPGGAARSDLMGLSSGCPWAS